MQEKQIYLREGMQVYDANNRAFGSVEEVQGYRFTVNDQLVDMSEVVWVDEQGVHLAGAYNGFEPEAAEEFSIPLVEERFQVGKREVDQGEVAIHKRVEREQVQVPIELSHEEVHVERQAYERPLQSTEAEAAFHEGTLRVPLHREQAVTSKEAVVSHEVEVRKTQHYEQQNLTDTVRRERVAVDPPTYPVEQYSAEGEVVTLGNDASLAARQSSNRLRHQLQQGMTVVRQDGNYLGQVKEVSDTRFVVDRAQESAFAVAFNMIQDVRDNEVVLIVAGEETHNGLFHQA